MAPTEVATQASQTWFGTLVGDKTKVGRGLQKHPALSRLLSACPLPPFLIIMGGEPTRKALGLTVQFMSTKQLTKALQFRFPLEMTAHLIGTDGKITEGWHWERGNLNPW